MEWNKRRKRALDQYCDDDFLSSPLLLSLVAPVEFQYLFSSWTMGDDVDLILIS